MTQRSFQGEKEILKLLPTCESEKQRLNLFQFTSHLVLPGKKKKKAKEKSNPLSDSVTTSFQPELSTFTKLVSFPSSAFICGVFSENLPAVYVIRTFEPSTEMLSTYGS